MMLNWTRRTFHHLLDRDVFDSVPLSGCVMVVVVYWKREYDFLVENEK